MIPSLLPEGNRCAWKSMRGGDHNATVVNEGYCYQSD